MRGPLAPVQATLAAAFGSNPPGAITRGLVVADPTGWESAESVVDGSLVPELLASVRRRRHASPPAAGALAWKAYSYAVALPAVLGWAGSRRVPLVRPAHVLVRLGGRRRAVLTVGLRPSIPVAVLPGDPVAGQGRADVEVAGDEDELLAALRGAVLDSHLSPLLGHLHEAVRLGARTLLGSLASGVSHAMLDAADVLPGAYLEQLATLLATLGVADLVDVVPGGDGRPEVRRRTCCLAFTLPTSRMCPGCCLRS